MSYTIKPKKSSLLKLKPSNEGGPVPPATDFVKFSYTSLVDIMGVLTDKPYGNIFIILHQVIAKLYIIIHNDIFHDDSVHTIQIKVIDNGIGINKDNLMKIFNLGFTTSQTKKGFGLHECANTIIEMNGSIDAHSDGEGNGACFTLSLTLRATSLSEAVT